MKKQIAYTLNKGGKGTATWCICDNHQLILGQTINSLTSVFQQDIVLNKSEAEQVYKILTKFLNK